MKSTVIAFLVCLLVLSAQGHSHNVSRKCRCSNDYIGKIHSRLIKSGPVIHHPSVFCPHVEIILTTTANQAKCVSPLSPLGKYLLSNMNKHQKTGPSSTTVASSSTSLYTTTRQ